MTIGIIGFGHLGRALTRGLLCTGLVKNCDITVCAKSGTTINTALNEYSVEASGDANLVLSKADLLFWVIKASDFDKLDLTPDLLMLKEKTHVSFMAGVSCEYIKTRLGPVSLVRAMPSLAIEACCGVIGHTQTDNLYLIELFQALGYAFETDESDIEKVTAYAACGPGFAAYIMKAFKDAGIALGFDELRSHHIMLQTFSFAAGVSDCCKLIERVATPGGATEKGLAHLRDHGFEKMIEEAFKEAYRHISKNER